MFVLCNEKIPLKPKTVSQYYVFKIILFWIFILILIFPGNYLIFRRLFIFFYLFYISTTAFTASYRGIQPPYKSERQCRNSDKSPYYWHKKYYHRDDQKNARLLGNLIDIHIVITIGAPSVTHRNILMNFNILSRIISSF